MSTPNDVQNATLSFVFDLAGPINPSIVPTAASPGTTFKLTVTPPKFFQKQDEGLTTNWKEVSLDYLFQNVGTGAQIVKNVNQTTRTVEFRSLTAGPGIILNQNVNDIGITAEVTKESSIVYALIFG